MHLTNMFGCSISPVGGHKTLWNRADQPPFFDEVGEFGGAKFERNWSDVVIPDVFLSRRTKRSKAVGNRALVLSRSGGSGGDSG